MKVIIPKMDIDNSKKTYILVGGKLKQVNPIYYLPINILFNKDNIVVPDKIYDENENYNLGDIVFKDDNKDTTYNYIAIKNDDTTFYIQKDYDGWSIPPLLYNFIQATNKDTSPIYANNYYFKTRSDDDNDYTDIFRARKDGISDDDNFQLIYTYVGLNADDENIKILSCDSFLNWDSSVTYQSGDIIEAGIAVIDDNSASYAYKAKILYKSLADNNTGNNPIDNPLYWELQPFMGQLAPFDKFMNTSWNISNTLFQAEYDDLLGGDYVAIIGAYGDNLKLIWNYDTDDEIIQNYPLKEWDLASDFYEYFYNEQDTSKKDFLIQKPTINSNSLKIEISGLDNAISAIFIGKAYDIGTSLYGYKKYSRDFSTKTTTTTGADYLSAGNQTKKYIVKVIIDNELAPKVFKLIQSLSTTLCIWALEDGDFVFGWYKDHYMTKDNAKFSEYEIEINGVI